MKKIIILFILSFVGIQASAQDYFITTWRTTLPGTSDSTSITIPTTGLGYNYDVDWKNDGNWETGFTGNASHNYGTPGDYTVAIRGDFPRIYFNNSGDKQKILSIKQWGSNTWSSMSKAFWGCTYLEGHATDTPNLSAVTDMTGMFAYTYFFNQDIDNWDVSNVTNMYGVFWEAQVFNQDIGNWDVSNVTSMTDMFRNARKFNGDIGNWNVSSVTNMRDVFWGASVFNQNIGNWNVSSVTAMDNMFSSATNFNQNLQPWCVKGIAGEPYNFSPSSALASGNKPLWGQACTEATITGNAGWRLLGLPASTTLRQLVGDNQIQGVAGGFAPSATSNVITYGAAVTDGWQVPAGIDSTLASGTGLAMYFFNTDSFQSKKLPAKLMVVGDSPIMDVQVPLNKTVLENGSYFTLVGNPYAGNFNVSGLTADADTIQDNIHFWDGVSYLPVDYKSNVVELLH